MAQNQAQNIMRRYVHPSLKQHVDKESIASRSFPGSSKAFTSTENAAVGMTVCVEHWVLWFHSAIRS